jgi:hypothetical protein
MEFINISLRNVRQSDIPVPFETSNKDREKFFIKSLNNKIGNTKRFKVLSNYINSVIYHALDLLLNLFAIELTKSKTHLIGTSRNLSDVKNICILLHQPALAILDRHLWYGINIQNRMDVFNAITACWTITVDIGEKTTEKEY